MENYEVRVLATLIIAFVAESSQNVDNAYIRAFFNNIGKQSLPYQPAAHDFKEPRQNSDSRFNRLLQNIINDKQSPQPLDSTALLQYSDEVDVKHTELYVTQEPLSNIVLIDTAQKGDKAYGKLHHNVLSQSVRDLDASAESSAQFQFQNDINDGATIIIFAMPRQKKNNELEARSLNLHHALINGSNVSTNSNSSQHDIADEKPRLRTHKDYFKHVRKISRKKCVAACKQTYKATCLLYKCSSKMKSKFRKSSIRNCKEEFMASKHDSSSSESSSLSSTEDC